VTDWDAGGWSGASQAQEEAWLATTPAQRLVWLEEAIVFARKALAAGTEATDPESPTTPPPPS
jgi:hypothetical protein